MKFVNKIFKVSIRFIKTKLTEIVLLQRFI